MKFDVALLLTALHLVSLTTAAPIPLHIGGHEEADHRLGSFKRRAVEDAGALSSSLEAGREGSEGSLHVRQLSYGAKGALAAVLGFGLAFAIGRQGDKQTLDNNFRELTGRPIKPYTVRQMDDLMRQHRWNPFMTYAPQAYTALDQNPAV